MTPLEAFLIGVTAGATAAVILSAEWYRHALEQHGRKERAEGYDAGYRDAERHAAWRARVPAPATVQRAQRRTA